MGKRADALLIKTISKMGPLGVYKLLKQAWFRKLIYRFSSKALIAFIKGEDSESKEIFAKVVPPLAKKLTQDLWKRGKDAVRKKWSELSD